MPTYDQLDNEAAWRAEVAAPALRALADRLRRHWPGAEIGIRGDNKHLRGYHRSRAGSRKAHFVPTAPTPFPGPRETGPAATRTRRAPSTSAAYLRVNCTRCASGWTRRSAPGVERGRRRGGRGAGLAPGAGGARQPGPGEVNHTVLTGRPAEL